MNVMNVTMTTNNNNIYTSRSAYLNWQRCHRDRFLSYEIFKGWEFYVCPNPNCRNTALATEPDDGVAGFCTFCESTMQRVVHCGGIEPIGQSIYLVVGSCVHLGLESMMRWAQMFGNKPIPAIPQDLVDSSVIVALESYRDALEAGIYVPKCQPEHRDWKLQEQGALIEGLIRAAAIRLLPNLFDRYKVLEVEKEDQFELGATPASSQYPYQKVVFQSRLDSLLEDRDTGDLHILSYKTGKQYGKSEEMQYRRDVQGISEAWGVEKRLGRKVEAVQMVVLLKGKEYEDKGSFGMVNGNAGAVEGEVSLAMDTKGRWVHYNPLTRAYGTFQSGITPEFDETHWAWSYDTMKTWVKGPKKGETYKGRLGNEWHPMSTWDNYPGGMKAWVEKLAGGELQPEMGDPLGGLFIMPEPWTRSEREVEDLLEELTCVELQIPIDAARINRLLGDDTFNPRLLRRELSQRFRRDTQSCYRYGGMCPNEGVCFGSLSLTPEDLVGVGKPWQLRRDHHAITPAVEVPSRED